MSNWSEGDKVDHTTYIKLRADAEAEINQLEEKATLFVKDFDAGNWQLMTMGDLALNAYRFASSLLDFVKFHRSMLRFSDALDKITENKHERI